MIDIARLSLKERQWLLRQDAILDGAQELMHTKGFSTMTMDDVANVVGISKATLYQHFPSKNELVIHVAIRKIDRAHEQMQAIDPDLPAGQRLRILLQTMIDIRFGKMGVKFVESIADIFQVLKQSHPFREKERRNAQLVAEFVEAAAKEGALVPGLSNFVVVRTMIGVMRYCEFETEIEEGKVTVEEITDTVSRMVLRDPK